MFLRPLDVAELFRTGTVVFLGIIFIFLIHYFLREVEITRPVRRLSKSNSGENEEDEILSQRKPAFWQSKSIRVFAGIAALVFCSRLIVYLVGYMSYMLFSNGDSGFLKSFEGIWNRWDCGHYLFIAKNWYVTVTDKKYLIVFFPFYSILIKIFSFVLENYFWSGILVSNLSLLTACIYLYRLVNIDFSEDVSLNSVKYLLFFPFSFFLSVTYSDSLFLALSIMTFYYLRKKNWFVAGMCGLFASLTRNFGLLLLLPAALEFLIQNKIFIKLKNKKFAEVVSEFARSGIFIFLIPLGFVIYLFINKAVTGNWFTFMAYQAEYWHHRFAPFVDLKEYAMNAIAGISQWAASDRISLWIPQVFLIILAMGFIFYAFRKIRYSYIVYMYIYLVFCLSVTWLLSGPRYLMGAFPLYILFSLLAQNKKVDIILSFASVMFLCFYTLVYTTGYRVM